VSANCRLGAQWKLRILHASDPIGVHGDGFSFACTGYLGREGSPRGGSGARSTCGHVARHDRRLCPQGLGSQAVARWKATLAALASDLRVRRNYPYAGKGDGLTSHMRLRFAQSDYVGIELEVNQGIVFPAGRRWTALRRMLIDSLQTACAA